MGSRKNGVHPVVDDPRTSSPATLPPLRRRSSTAQQTAVTTLGENDDEAERRARRLQKTPQAAHNERRSLGLSFVAQIPGPQMAERVSQCIKMSAENKINARNAFSLEMIDFMTYLVKKHDAVMNNLQMASTSLDVSAKIYGFRVDCVHTDVLKMVGAIDGKKDAQRDNPEDHVEGEIPAEARKRKKPKSRNKILGTIESFRGFIETINQNSLMVAHEDHQTTDMLYQAMLPFHANCGLDLNLYNDVILDTVDPTVDLNINDKITARVESFTDLHICSSFANFEFLGWSIDDEIDCSSDASETSSGNNNDFHFDLDANLPIENDSTNNSAIENQAENENGEVCRFANDQRLTANIIDLADIVQATDNERLSEYSYLSDNLDILWAGPSHWKIRYPSKDLGQGDIVGACRQRARRQRKELLLAYDQETLDNIDAEFEIIALGRRAKILTEAAKNLWSEDKHTLPQDVLYDELKFCRSYRRPGVIKRLPQQVDADATHLSDGIGDYDYSNEHDVDDYCPNMEPDEQGSNEDNTPPDFDETAGSVETHQAFTGDNLVEAPAMVNKIFIPYSQRARKIDMRQLKKAMWKELTSDSVVEENNDEDTQRIRGTKQFSDVHKNVRKNLSKGNAETLSAPIAFLTLLHLANEKNLIINATEQLNELEVQQE